MHSADSAKTASADSDEHKRVFRYPPLSVFCLVFVNAKADKCKDVDRDQVHYDISDKQMCALLCIFSDVFMNLAQGSVRYLDFPGEIFVEHFFYLFSLPVFSKDPHDFCDYSFCTHVICLEYA